LKAKSQSEDIAKRIQTEKEAITAEKKLEDQELTQIKEQVAKVAAEKAQSLKLETIAAAVDAAAKKEV